MKTTGVLVAAVIAKAKRLLPLEEYLIKLKRVLEARQNLFVVARTDASDPEDQLERALAFEDAGADAILFDGLVELDFLSTLSSKIGVPLMFNQISGGKSPNCDLDELKTLGVSLVNYSTPTLFAAHDAIVKTVRDPKLNSGKLPNLNDGQLDQCFIQW